MNTGRKRKPRKDRPHIIYQLTVGNKSYVGVTFVRKQSVAKTMRARIIQHWYNAHNHNYQWGLSAALRKLDSIEDVEYEVLERVKGKQAAHARERELISELRPKLNTDIRQRW